MLRDLNLSSDGKRDSTSPRVGVLASEIPAGFPLESFLFNDVDAGAVGRFYSLEILTLPSAGKLYLDKAGVGEFSGAPAGTYTGTQRVDKYDPGVGLVSTATGTYTLQVNAPIQNDSESPIIPGVLLTSGVSSSGFTVRWQAASDNVGVIGYEVSVDRGTAAYKSYGAELTAKVSALSPSTQYTVRVRAYDAAGNRSTALTSTVTTAITVDAVNPVFSGPLLVTNKTETTITVSWGAATDNVGVVDYEMSVDTGDAPIFFSAGTNRTKEITSLLPGTTYTIRVRAVDSEGNRSSTIVTTAATVGVTPAGLPIESARKSGEAPIIVQLSALSATPVTITYKVNTGQELVLFNNSFDEVVVTLKGSAAGPVTTKGLAGVTIDLSGGLPITVPVQEFVLLKLDNAALYLKGAVTLTAATSDAVVAGILQ